MNVAVADVAEGHRADARHHRLDQRRGARDELRHPGDGHRDVVLDGAALELLRLDDAFADGPERRGLARVGSERRVADQPVLDGCRQELLQALAQGAVGAAGSERSEERRVGKEGVTTCRSRWSPYHSKKKKTTPSINT